VSILVSKVDTDGKFGWSYIGGTTAEEDESFYFEFPQEFQVGFYAAYIKIDYKKPSSISETFTFSILST